MKINHDKRKKRVSRVRVKYPLGYSLGDHNILEGNSFKYLGIILRSHLNWVEQLIYRVPKAWKALHFVMRVVKKGNRNTQF